MKISILTIHSIHNFGSVFQAYALCKYLNDQGYEAEIIDYNPIYFRRKSLKTIIGQWLFFKQYNTRKRKFETFINENIRLSSHKYFSLDDLKDNPPQADIYIAGGDQLWNSYHDSGRDSAFKLPFVNGYKISYGTSMGRDNYTNTELQKLKDELQGFNRISVRESSSVKLLNSVGINNVTQVVDPVLLLSKDEYEQFIKKPQIDNYLFVYLVQPTELLNKAVEYLAKELELKVVLYGGLSKKCKYDFFLKDLGPSEVLSYIKHADFVLSASFHATVFSIIYHKPFATLLPNKQTNDRIEDILNWSELSHRIIKSPGDLNDQLLTNIDFVSADQEVEKRISKSREWLETVINNF
ncbi:MAG: polysaccharide pyruvyl transferase family protein [Bacillota bacterium]